MLATIILSAIALFAVIALMPLRASAHCDTEDGPAVVDGHKALQTGNVNYALKWIFENGEAELRPIFERAIRVRSLGGEAAEVADRHFLENLVRIHRAGEGAGYDGIKPTGTALDPKVIAADAAMLDGNLDPLLALMPAEQHAELRARFDRARASLGYDINDLTAARAHEEDYVSFFKYAEGHDHEHGHGGCGGAHHHHHAH